jgi:hypothetical protein
MVRLVGRSALLGSSSRRDGIASGNPVRSDVAPAGFEPLRAPALAPALAAPDRVGPAVGEPTQPPSISSSVPRRGRWWAVR